MEQSTAVDESGPKPVDQRLMIRVFYAFAVLALLSVAISVAGKWLGRSIALAGHTEDTTVHEVVIGNNVLAVPANVIRLERARRDGVADRLDLYLRWPEMTGYAESARGDFNNTTSERRILFLSFEKQMMSRDMSGRFEPIYEALIAKPGVPSQGGIVLYGFAENSGYVNEVLAVAERDSEQPFVARCMSGPDASNSLAPCERDVLMGDGLSLTYRFPKELLPGWRALDAAVMATARSYLKSAG
jgi:hypothetical protein